MSESQEKEMELVCAYHPGRPTMLRCNRCEKPICTACAVLTPTGYRCKECVRSQQKTFNTAVWSDYVIGILIAGFLGFAGSYVVSYIGFFTLLLAPIAGTLIAEVVRRSVRRRRSRELYFAVTAAAVVGGVPLLLLVLLNFRLFSILWQGAYLFLMASTLYYRLSGIQLGRR